MSSSARSGSPAPNTASMLRTHKTTDSSVTPPVTSYRFFIGSDDGNVYAFSSR